MRLLTRKRDDQDEAPAPEAPAEPVSVTTAGAPPEAPPEGVRSCPTCQAPLEPEQDWCLQCGAAQTGLAGRMPGMRAAGTVVALTAVLVGGAVAASYAALRGDSSTPGAGTTQVAQLPQQPPPAVAAPSTATPPATDAVPTTPTPVDTPPPADTPASPPASSAPASPPPASPPASSGGGTSGGGSSGGGASGGSSGTDTGSGSGSGGGSSSGSGSSGDDTTTTPAEPAPQPIDLATDAGTLYDPYGRDTAAGDPARAMDGNVSTSFPIAVADGSATIGAGLALDLGKKRAVREIDLTLKTPGVGLEVYGTTDADLPPNVLDSRWAHLRTLKSAGDAVDGHQTIELGKGKRRYRHLLLWFTSPPDGGTTARITELQLLD